VSKWKYEEDDDFNGYDNFQKVKKGAKPKLPEYSREDNRKVNKPQRKIHEIEEDDDD
jgi:hypothetical protein